MSRSGLRWPLAAALWALARSAVADVDAHARAEVPLWNGDPPGNAAAAQDEQIRLTELGEHIVTHVHRPTLNPYVPDARQATGTAVIVVPGGGHRELWMDHEGYRVALWLREHGIAAFVLKYRLAAEPGSHYTIEGDELADVQRAIRLVRHRANDWHVDPNRVGVLGFSAGGELALLAATRVTAPNGTVSSGSADVVDRESSQPAFAGLMYPGFADVPEFHSAPPPMFLLCGEQDLPIASRLPALQLAIGKAGGSAELHILAHAGHGFGMRDANPPAIAIWSTLFYNWLGANGLLKIPSASASVLSEPMRAAFPGATPIPAYGRLEIAQALRSLLASDSAPALEEPQLVTPSAPYAAGSAHLSFWKPAFLLGTAGRGEAGFNFWNLYNEGHVNVGFTRSAGARVLLDCQLYSSGNVAFRIYAGEDGVLDGQGELKVTNGHALLLLPARTHSDPVSVELWPNPSHALLGFFGCALWPYSISEN